MRCLKAFALGLILTVLTGAVDLRAGESSSAFSLAMLRRDGILVPFAVTDGKKWSSPWPVPKYRLEAPLAFADIPKDWWGDSSPADTWTGWPTGGERRTLHVTGPVVFTAHCLSNVGLRTDYRSVEPLPPPDQQHHPKDGVATTGAATVEPIEILGDQAPEWGTALDFIRSAIEKAESKAADTDSWERLYRWRERRATTPLKLEVLCRSKGPSPGTVVIYFEAVREFRELRAAFDPAKGGSTVIVGGDRGGSAPRAGLFSGLDIFSQGFVVLDGKTVVRESIASTFTNPARDEVDYGLPLGTITVNGRINWIMHWSGRGRERYTILEAGDKGFKRVVDVPGGAC